MLFSRKAVALVAGVAVISGLLLIDASGILAPPAAVESAPKDKTFVLPAPPLATEQPSDAPPTPQPTEAPLADPLWVQFPAAGIDQPYKVTPESRAYYAGTPRDKWDITWWSAGGRLGATPDNTEETAGQDYTVQFAGHSSDGSAVFNELRNVTIGDEMKIGSQDGFYRYEVVETFLSSKVGFEHDPRYRLDQANRVVVYTCERNENHVPGTATTEAFVTVLQFVEYVPNM